MSNKIQFKNFIVYDHATSGIETKAIQYNRNNTYYSANFYNDTFGPSIVDSVIIGNSNSSAKTSITRVGLVIAWDRGQLIKNVKLINFPDENSSAIGATNGTCS